MTDHPIDGSAGLTEQLIEASPDGVVIVGPDGLIQLVNAQTEKLFGYRREELIGRPVEMLVPERARDHHPSHRAGYFERPSTRPMGAGLDLTARRKDGREFAVDIALSYLHTDEGGLVSAAIRDITDRREAEAARARLAAIVDSSVVAIIGKTINGTITSWNPAAREVFGWSAEETVGRQVNFLIPPERHAEERQIQSRITGGQQVDQYETERLHKNGRRLTVTLSASPIRAPSGEIVGFSAIYRDITSLKKAEAMFEGLLEGAADAIVLVGQDGAIRLVNAQAEKLFGYSRDELLGQRVEVLVPERVRDLHPTHRAAYFEHPVTRPMGADLELTARRKDGSEFPVDIALASIEMDDEILVSAAVRDISERIRAAQEKEKLEARLRRTRLESIGQLAGGIAHDFNNLLAGIMSYARLVQDGIKDQIEGRNQDAESQHLLLEDVGKILRATDRAAALTHQLLLFGRKDVKKEEIIDLNRVVEEMEDMLRRTIGEHVRLITRLTKPLMSVSMDSSQLEQILMNLVVNARDAMAGGGRLMVETTEVDLDEHYASAQAIKAGHYVTLSVSDTGSGMDPEVAKKAFEPFFSTKPRGEGSGLGLATVYGIVIQANGHASIYSEPGIGTTVRVYLPAVESPAEIPSKEKIKVGPVKGETILLVEDEEIVRQPAGRFLENAGYRVLIAEDPGAALVLADEYPDKIDLLLTDVVMPGMTGKEMAAKLLVERPGMRVIYISGYSEDVIVHQGAVEEGVVLVQKPFTAEALLSKVREVLDAQVA
ncbi:MAG TPA: PAS domain S-box protein [Actinomycetota bacterium]|nr:PAS domain S-box protein [Actinomycetota bacterium]